MTDKEALDELYQMVEETSGYGYGKLKKAFRQIYSSMDNKTNLLKTLKALAQYEVEPMDDKITIIISRSKNPKAYDEVAELLMGKEWEKSK